jgi:hypothetical protein
MADEKNTPPAGDGNDIADLRAKIFEMKILLESLSAGFEALANMPAATVIGGELTVLRALITQTVELYETLSKLWLQRLGEAPGKLALPPNWRRSGVASFCNAKNSIVFISLGRLFADPRRQRVCQDAA